MNKMNGKKGQQDERKVIKRKIDPEKKMKQTNKRKDPIQKLSVQPHSIAINQSYSRRVHVVVPSSCSISWLRTCLLVS